MKVILNFTFHNFCKKFKISFLINTPTIMTKFEATSKVQIMRHYKTDDEICKIIGITKPTLYVRLSTHNWKIAETYLIDKQPIK